MANWGLPTLTSDYDDFLSELADRDVSNAKMFDGTSETSLMSGAIGYDTASDRFRKWNGASWTNVLASVYAHIASTSNPHSVTAAQVGAPTTSAFNSHTSDTANPHATTASQVGAPTNSAFLSHTGNVLNPHATTASQVGAPTITSNLSEYSATAATARTNIGAASAATLSSHTANTSNPHSVTRAQLSAAESGVNGDITQLTACARMGHTANSTLYDCSTLGIHLFNFGGTSKWQLGSTYFAPSSNGLNDIGASTSQYLKDFYFAGKLRRASGRGSWTFFGGQPVSISSLDSELTLTSSFDSNAQALLRAAARGVNQIAKWLVDHGIAD